MSAMRAIRDIFAGFCFVSLFWEAWRAASTLWATDVFLAVIAGAAIVRFAVDYGANHLDTRKSVVRARSK